MIQQSEFSFPSYHEPGPNHTIVEFSRIECNILTEESRALFIVSEERVLSRLEVVGYVWWQIIY